jgi:hypothetical protein
MNNYRYHEPTDENPFDESIEKGLTKRIIVSVSVVLFAIALTVFLIKY